MTAQLAVTRASDVRESSNRGVLGRQIMGGDDGAGVLSVGELAIRPGAVIRRHRHRVEEVFFLISGAGTLETNQESVRLAPGDAVAVPANTFYSFTNDGDEDVRSVYVFPSVKPATQYG